MTQPTLTPAGAGAPLGELVLNPPGWVVGGLGALAVGLGVLAGLGYRQAGFSAAVRREMVANAATLVLVVGWAGLVIGTFGPSWWSVGLAVLGVPVANWLGWVVAHGAVEGGSGDATPRGRGGET